MQKTLRWYGLLLLTLLCTVWRAEAQVLTEDFNFTGALTANGWTAHSAGGTNAISASATGLTYSGLTSAGNAAAMTTSGEDINRTFTAQTSGSVYASFLLNVSAAQSAGDYFFHLGGNPIGSTFVNRLFARSATGGFQLGLSFNSSIPAAPVYDPTVYTFGQTYLIVVKYTFVAGTGNDILTFYVNPGVGVSEPGSGAITTITTTSDAASLASVALRQGSAGSSPTLTIDRLRVGTSWSDVTAGTPSTTPTITASPTALTVTSYAVSGGPAAAGNSFVVSGSNLNPASGFVSASAPPNFEISTSSTSGFTSSITNIAYSGSTLASTTLYARLVAGLSASTYTGNVTVSGGSATTTVALSGTVNAVAGCPTSGAMSIACARQIGMNVGVGNVNSSQSVTVTGVVTVSSQFGGTTFYIQDNTGGIAVYAGTAPGLSRTIGETVTVSGNVTYFFGLVEIVNPVVTSPTAGSAPTAAALTGVSDMTTAAKQGTLVSLSGVTITDTREVFNNKANYSFSTSGGNGQLRMQPDLQDLINSVIPKTPLTLTGILDFYDPDDNPATTGDITYQINPRFNADVPGTTEYTPASGPANRNTTLDVASFNLEWLGSTSNGPRNSGSGDATQIANAITALKALDADIYCIPEVVSETALQGIVDGLSAAGGLNTPFTKVCPASTCGSYGGAGNQKVCFIYKNSVFSNVTTTCMNESFGQTSNDWASGRFPFMLSADVTVNSVMRPMKFIGIHAKAGDTQADFTRRKAASDALHTWLDANNATDRIVIMGDLNDDLDESITRTVAGTAFEPTSYSAFTGAPTKYTATTLMLSQKGFSSTLGFDNVIDHIIVSNEVTPALIANTQYAYSPDVITTANGNFDWLNTLSDHVPVVARFDISQIVDCNFTAGFTQASPLSVCRGSNLTITATGGDTYSWSGPTNAAFTSSGATATITNAANNNDGRYTVSVTKTGCSNTATATIRVNVLTRPTADPIANNPVCRGTEIQLSAAAGNSNYSWAGPAGVTFSSTASSPSWTRTGATTAMEGTYTVTVTGTNNCTNTGTVNVNVVGLPANVSATNNANTVNNAICEGATINLLGSSTSMNITFLWAAPDGYTSMGANPSRSAATVAMAGVYTVTARTNNSCTATATTSVNIKPAPVPSTSANSPCVGEALELSASGGVSYNWIGPDGSTFSTSGSTSTWVRSPATLAMSGSYTVTVVGANSCTSATTFGVTVRALPVPTIASNSPVCRSGATIRLAAGGGVSYNWAGPAGFSSTEAEPSTPSSGFATTANAGMYSVTVIGANSCTATTQTNVQVVSTLTISISASASIPVCQGSSLSLTASGAEAYSWTRRPVGFTSNAVSPTLPYTSTVTFNNIGTADEGAYIVFGQSGSCVTSIVISVATRNCTTCSIAFSATATPNPVCIGGRIQLTSVVPLPSSPNGTYLWRGPNNFQSSLRNPVINNAGTNRSGVYTVTFRPTAAQSCIYTATALVSVINCSATRIASAEAPAGIQLSASPNPTDGRVKVTIQLETPSVVSLQMSDLLGRSLESWDSGEEQLVHEFDISMEQYKSGMYLLTAEAGQQRAVKKVIKIQK
jgi:hypothetical protein